MASRSPPATASMTACGTCVPAAPSSGTEPSAIPGNSERISSTARTARDRSGDRGAGLLRTRVMLRYEAESSAPPRVVWPLLAEPARWHEWAPHVRGAIRLGAPEVVAGRRGFVRLAGV